MHMAEPGDPTFLFHQNVFCFTLRNSTKMLENALFSVIFRYNLVVGREGDAGTHLRLTVLRVERIKFPEVRSSLQPLIPGVGPLFHTALLFQGQRSLSLLFVHPST